MTGDQLDLAYLRERPDNLERLIEHQRIRETPLPGGDTCHAQRLTLDDGSDLFTKTLADAPPGFFDSEAAGLRWLGEAGPDGVRVPEVIAVGPKRLVLAWIDAGDPSAIGMARFGRALAAVHAAGADRFGAPWPGFLGRLALDNTAAAEWPTFFAEQRLRPFLRLAVDRARIDPGSASAVERVISRLAELAGAPEPPARLHGDLWAGNVMINRAGEPYVIDPAAHGGHRETDLAMLQLFSPPHVDQLIAAYDETSPLADGWRDRVGLHQLHPLLVHAASFGGGYGARAGEVARQYA